ncbi:MAG: SDR family oxidoreductase [Pseudomonadales bacterium]|nr:SDR family oxidoreductase [Pseudomonadales bacterium]
MLNILIIGSGSAIAQKLAITYAQQHQRLFLIARNADSLERQRTDLMIRGAHEVATAQADLDDVNAQHRAIAAATDFMTDLDVVLICHGLLPDQQACAFDYEQTLASFQTNALSTISLLSQLAPMMKARHSGCLAVITSVAGERGRASNYVYGAAKGMVSLYLQGLRASLSAEGVTVLDIRPGFIDTPMTRSFRKGLLWSTPEKIAPLIIKGIERKRNIIYTPAYWRYIMWLIRAIPEALFKRLSL